MVGIKKVLRLYAGRDESKIFSFGMIVLIQLLMMLAMQSKFFGNIIVYVFLGMAAGFRASKILERKDKK